MLVNEPPPTSCGNRWYGGSAGQFEIARDPEARFDQLPEGLVQDIWRNCDFDSASLRTFAGQRVQVRYAGHPNSDGGPDFRHARMRIGQMEWVGDVEIHLTSEDWYRHGHHRDDAYNSVILHVTLLADLWTGNIVRQDGTVAAELVLSEHLTSRLRTLLYRFRTRERNRIVCAADWPEVPQEVRARAILRSSRLRLLRSSRNVENLLLAGHTTGEVLYRHLFRSLGYAKNESPMLELATRIPLSLAEKLRNPMDLEALFLGTAGLIPETGHPSDDERSLERIRHLSQRFKVLSDKITAEPMVPTQWQFFRLRPSNFPPMRIAQGCALIGAGRLDATCLISHVAHPDPRSPNASLRRLVEHLQPPVPAFWETHYRLERPSRPHSPQLGLDRIHRLVINAVLPVAVASAESEKKGEIVTRCVELLKQIPGEDDEITRAFHQLGTEVPSAHVSQGLHELYKSSCEQHRCLRCAVGRHILRPARE